MYTAVMGAITAEKMGRIISRIRVRAAILALYDIL